MTSNHCFVNASECPGAARPIHPPRPVRLDFFVGLDLGQLRDHSAIAVLERSEVCIAQSLVTYQWLTQKRSSLRHLERFPLGVDYPAVVERVKVLVSSPELQRGPVSLIVDATGVGRPVIDLLRRAHLPCRLTPVTITAGDRESSDASGWRVPKRDLITGLLVLFQSGRLDVCGHLHESETLISELTNTRVKISLAGHDSYGSWREGEHDDLVLAAALACWTAGRTRPSHIDPLRLPQT